jgi:dGTPase
MLGEVELSGSILRRVRGLYPTLDPVRTGHELMRRQITLMVEDVIGAANLNLAEIRPGSVEEVHRAGRAIVAFSPSMRSAEKELKAFLYANLYRNPVVLGVREGADRIVRDLFDAYFADPGLMPEGWRDLLDKAEVRVKARHVADFLAGMTDNYAIKEHRRLFDHTPELG